MRLDAQLAIFVSCKVDSSHCRILLGIPLGLMVVLSG
jgi:hypothetical protein